MASKTVKGLTVEINGDTTKLGKALQTVERQSRNLSKELTDVQKLLRYDSTNVEALTQKKELLTKAVAACADKLEILREAEKQVQEQFKKGDVSEEQVRALKREIEATDIKMKDYQKSLDGTYGSLNKLGVETEDVQEATKRMAQETEDSKSTMQKLTEALDGTDAKLKGLGKELGEIDKLLKTNGDNADLNAQRMKVLEETWNACSEKVYYLEKAAAELQEQFKRNEISGDQLREGLRSIERQTIECQSVMERYGNELRGVTTEQDQFGAEVGDTEPHIDRIGDRVKELDERYEQLTSQLRDVNTVLKQSPGNVTALAAKKDILSRAVATATERVDALRKAQQQAKRQFEIGEISDDQFDDIRIATAKAEAELEDMSGELRDLGTKGVKNMDKLEDETKEAGGAAEKAKQGFTVFKDVLADIIADVLREFVDLMREATGYILQVGMDFEKSMSKVNAILQPTGEEMENLTQLALDLGESTAFSAVEVADAMTYLAQAGWTYEEIIAGLPGVLALAATEGMDLATAAEICSDAMNSMGYDASQAGKFADVLATVAAKSSTNVTELGYAFQYVGPIAGALGFEIEDVAVALGLMADAGIKGERAGTSLRSILTNLSKPTAEMQAAMEKYGISLYDSEGNMLSFSEIMVQLRDVFSGLTEQEQIALATILAGKTGMSGLLAIVNASPEAFNGMCEAMDESTGAAEKMSTTMQDNLAGDVEKLGGAFDTFAIKIVQKFNEPLRQAVQAITGFLEGSLSMTDMLNMLKDAFLQMVEGFKEYLPTLQQMGSELLAFIVDGIATGFPLLIDTLLEMVSTIGQYLAEQAPAIVQFGADLIGHLIQGIVDLFPMLIDIGGDILGSLSTGIEQGTEDFISNALTLTDGFIGKLEVSLPNFIEKGGEFLINMAKGISDALPEFISRAPEIISRFAKMISENSTKIYKVGLELIWELIKGIIKAIPELIMNAPKIVMAIVDVWNACSWWNLGKAAIELIGEGIMSLLGWLGDIGKNLVIGLWEGIKSMGNWLWDQVCGFGDWIIGGIADIFGIHSPSTVMAEMGKYLDQGLAKGILDNMSDPLNAASKMAEGVIGTVGGFDGLSVERSIKQGDVRKVMEVTAMSDNSVLGKLDSIVSAIKQGQVLTIDGKALVGSTAQMYDNNLGQRRALVARGAI